ncbi:MAG: calcium/sodium antiporter [Proteobacteria bacterium]|nr:calcium/sodium antiporter [Pseudomonadota bacterium]
MLIAAAAILAGFIILIWSADLFVSGAASIAENMGMSPIVIGLTIVSLGTSAPEVVVSIIAATSDAGDLAVGNAIGSNIANTGLVLGITLLIVPMCVHHRCMKQEVPALLVVTLGVGLLLLDGVISKLDGVLMMGALFLILFQMVRSQAGDTSLLEEAEEEPLQHLNPMRAWLTFAIGLALLIASSRLLVWGAISIAEQWGVPELIIGLTIVAIGTSLPELAATVASALRGHTEIALGNIIGSNLFNLLGVMSIPGLINGEILEPSVLTRDYAAMSGIILILAVGIHVGRKRKAAMESHSYLGRSMGALLLSLYGGYYYWLFMTI